MGSSQQRPNHHLDGKIGCRGCRAGKVYSKVSMEWLKIIAEYHQINIQHAENGDEYRIPFATLGVDHLFPESKYASIDGVCHDSLSLFEFNGCWWHGCGSCYPDPNYVHSLNKKTMLELRECTRRREKALQAMGFDQVIIIWECEWRTMIKEPGGIDPERNDELRGYLDAMKFN